MARPSTPQLWVAWAAGLLGAASVALAQPTALDASEVLEGLASGSAGMPWLRVRAAVLAMGSMLPIGTLCFRLGVTVAVLHAALAAVVARRTCRGRGDALLGGCGVLAGALTVSFPVALDAVRAPSAAALGVIVLLLALEGEALAAAFAAGLLLAIDPLLLVLGAIPLWLRVRTLGRRELLWAFTAGALPLLVWFVPGRAVYTFPWSRPVPWGGSPFAALHQLGWAAAALAAAGTALSFRDRETVVRASLLVSAALASLAAGPELGRSSLLLAAALVAELAATAVWLGGSLLVKRRVPLARASVALVLLLLLAWPLARLDAAVGQPTLARVADACEDLPLGSSVPARALLLLRDDAAERWALAAQAAGSLPASVDVLPLRHVESTRVQEALTVDPSLSPLVRETLLGGAPSELSLSNVAAQRPTFVELAPSMPKPLAKHLVPEFAWPRFDAEPRGASDRAAALDAQRGVREVAGSHLEDSDDHGRRLVRASRRLAVSLAATGEKESMARGIAQLRAVAGDEPLASLLVRKSVLADTSLSDVVLDE